MRDLANGLQRVSAGGTTTQPTRRLETPATMKPNVRAAARTRPNRLLIALAAAWMILSLAIGGAVHADASADAAPAPAVAESTQD